MNPLRGAWALSIIVLFVTSSALARTVLVFGDSLSATYGIKPEQGWVKLLEQRLQAKGYEYRVVNASVSGETTAGGLQRLPRALQQHQPSILILELGANDGLRGLSVAVTQQNLQQMLQAAQQSGASVLLVGIRMPPNYGPRYAAEFNTLYRNLSSELDIPLLPFFLQNVALKPELMQADGLHPTASAQPILLDTLWPKLEPLLQKP